MAALGRTKCKAHVWFRAPQIPLLPLSPAAITAANLDPITSKVRQEYVHFAAERMEQRPGPGKTFPWLDDMPDRLARVRAAEVVVSQVGLQNPKEVPAGMIQDWVGAVFIVQAMLKGVLGVLGDYTRYKDFYHQL